MKKSELRKLIREELKNIREESSPAKIKKIDGVTVVNNDGDIELHIPQGMDGEKLKNWKTKNKKELDSFKKSFK